MSLQYTSYAAPRADLGEAFHEFAPDGQRFIAEQILPVREVLKKEASMSVITRKNLKRSDTKHANGAAFNRIALDAKDMSYKCEDNGLEIAVTDDDRENYASDFDAEIESVEVLKQRMLMEREIRVKALIFNTTTFTGATLYKDNSGTPWVTNTTDVISQILVSKEVIRLGTGVSPNALLLGEASLCQLLGNTVLRARFPGAALITEEMLRSQMAAIFGLSKLIVGGAVYDGAKEGQDFSGTDIWGSTYAMVAKIQEGSTKVNPGLGRSIVWTPMDRGVESIVQYREEQTASDILRSQEYRQEKIFDAYFAQLMKINT
jgi:hypothetical protein